MICLWCAAQHYGDMHYPISFGGELHYPVGFLWKTEADMLGEQKPKEPCVANLLPLAVNTARAYR